MDRTELGLRLQSWHASMSDPIYAVGSFYFSGHVYPKREVVEDAIHNLNSDLSKRQRMLAGENVRAPTAYGYTDDLRKFAGYTDEQLNEDIADLEEIVGELQKYLERDYSDVREG